MESLRCNFSKVLKTVAVIAAIVAVVATIAFLLGPAIAGAGVLGASWMAIAAGASVVATLAGMGAQMTAKPPDMKGSINSVLIGRNMPIPYILGRTYSGGVQVYDKSAPGPSGSPNKDRSQVMVVSAAGPVQGFESFLGDYTAISFATVSGGLISGVSTDSYYGADGGYLWLDTRLGARPETAFTAPAGRAAMTEWDSTYKLSGYAAYRVTMEFDEDGERYAAGVPQWGAVLKGPKVYDPRLDSTYPGGSGACRWTDESTFVYGTGANPSGENPAIQALTYARGRFIEKTAGGAALVPPVKILGCGFKFADIEVDQFVELANLCDANGWKVGGSIYEGPGLSKWDNLKRILDACAAEPTWSGGKLGVKISAPRTSVVTIGLPDLMDGELSVQAMQSFRDKVNTIVPRVRLENQRWEYTQIDEVTSSTYLTEDGEPKSTERQFDLCQQVNQGKQLAAYVLVNGREFGPITLPLKPAFMVFQVGEAVTINIPELGLSNQLAVITNRQVDPGTGGVNFSLESETNAKHAFALGQTGTAPPTPTLIPPSTVDGAVKTGKLTTAQITALINSSYVKNLTLSISTAGVVTISAHQRVYSDKTVNVNGGTVTPSPAATNPDKIGVYYDDTADRLGGAVTYQYLKLVGGTGQIDSLYPSAANPYRHFVCLLTVPSAGTGTGGSGTGTGTGGVSGGGGGLTAIP